MEKYKIKDFYTFNEQSLFEMIDNEIYLIQESSTGKLNIKKTIKRILNKVKNMNLNTQKKALGYMIAGLLMIAPPVIIETTLDDPDIKQEMKTIDPGIENIILDKIESFTGKFKSVPNMRLSHDGWKMIKHEEGRADKKGEPALKAYKLGDGMITIGWGHAEKVRRSKFKVGDEITKEEAQKLLEEDLMVAANGVRKIFTEWEGKGIDVKLTQDQFDVLVSLAFNSGVGSLRRSNLIQQIKRGNLKKAGEMIKNYKIKKKFKDSLKSRRSRESEKFLNAFKN